MSILNPLSWFNSPTPETKASTAGSLVLPYGVGDPIWAERDYASFAREAYQLNPIGYRCVKMIAICAAAPAWVLHDSAGNEIDTHPLLDLLDRPAPGRGGSFLFESVYTYLMLSGNSYIEKVGPSGGPPTELWPQRPDRMRVIPGRYGMPQAYEFHNGGNKKQWPVNPLTMASDVLHVREFSPLDDWYGLSRVEPASQAVDRHNKAAAHNKALLDNGARPSGALVFETVTADGQMVSAPAEIIEKAERELMNRHGGPGNAGKPLVIGGNVKWEEMGLSPKDMDFDNSKQDAARDICVAFGVPHLLIVRGSATYNNVRDARMDLYESTVLPIMGNVISELNAWLVPTFGDGLTLSADLDSIPALEPRRETRRKTYTELLDKGVLDSNEVRAALQYGPRDPASVLKVDAATLTSLANSVSITGMQPLVRYMKSVGLFDPAMTEEQVIAQALTLVDDEPEADDLDLENEGDENE